MIRKVIVLGGGSAGFLTAIALKKHLPTLDVLIIRSKEIGIIGVGEGTTIGFTSFLHDYLKVGLRKFWEVAQPTWKLGLRFEWGPRPYFNYSFAPGITLVPPKLSRPAGYYCGMNLDDTDIYAALMGADKAFEQASPGIPKLHNQLAYHFENENLVHYLEALALHHGVETLEDTVDRVEQDDAGIAALAMKSSTSQRADLFVDCSGFSALLLGKTLGVRFIPYDKNLFCDRAVIGGWPRTTEVIKPYTTCETMTSGWSWQIEHEKRINRGYVYSSSFISDEDADREFRNRNPRIENTRVVRFVSGRYERSWVKNVVAIGNSSGFVEPLEATALGVIAAEVGNLVGALRLSDLQPRPIQFEKHNESHARQWDAIRDFLTVHYKFNHRIDSPFWKHCQEETDLAGAAGVVEWYQRMGPSAFWDNMLFDTHDGYKMGGYATLMMGQGVPFESTFVPSAEETGTWESLRERQARFGRSGVGVREALKAIRSPQWQWEAR
jgi:tryptophan 7-halogenase